MSPDKKSETRIKAARSRLEPLPDLLERVGVADDDWDVAIFGDGSGSGWDRGCGWSAILIEKHTRVRKLFYGACNNGAIGFAELMPYFNAITWYHAASKQSGRRIHVVSDSQYVVEVGNRARKNTVKANYYLWSMFDHFKRQGLKIKWHWMRRDGSALNKIADNISRKARIHMAYRDLQKEFEHGAEEGDQAVRGKHRTGRLSIHRFNPMPEGE